MRLRKYGHSCLLLEERSESLLFDPGQRELRSAGVEAVVAEEGVRSYGAFRLRMIPSPHAPILGSIPPENTAYLVNDRLLNPGDSFDARLAEFKDVPVLALPVTAPWTTELDSAGFADRIAPRRVVPGHDGYLREFFRERRHRAFGQHFERKRIGFETGSGVDFPIEL